MFDLFAFLLGKGIVTNNKVPDELSPEVSGYPTVTDTPCSAGCDSCAQVCPTNAVKKDGTSVSVDLGACIGCSGCIAACPTNTLIDDRSTSIWSYTREGLIKTAAAKSGAQAQPAAGLQATGKALFAGSLSVRVVSTGCSACDLELSAAGNAIFDMERFGVHVVASPRYADALVVTGPVPKAMQEPLKRCYEAMGEPRLVIALGTCAVSGGVHAGGYTEANGAAAVLPVDVFIPGCPPHPWQIIQGIAAAKRIKVEGRTKKIDKPIKADETTAEPLKDEQHSEQQSLPTAARNPAV